MAYNEQLAEKIRHALAATKKVEEKKMFGGIAFMVDEKMCVGVDKNDLMLRCDPIMADELLAKKGVRPFDLTGKPMKGWLLIGPDAINSKENLDWWVNKALEANKKLKPAKKKK